MTNKRDTNWQYSGDVNPQLHGGTWFRRAIARSRQFQFIRLTNMDDACGSDNEGRPTYVVELSLVDLDAIDEQRQENAIRSCGQDGTELSDAWRAVACFEYGALAPLESWEGTGSSALLRRARKLAHELQLDSALMAERMERPVNAIGSTAAEYMVGDTHSAVLRGVSEGRPDAEILLKMGA